MVMTIKRGWCDECRNSVKLGQTRAEVWEARHNCNSCGYMNRYDDTLIVLKRGKVVEIY